MGVILVVVAIAAVAAIYVYIENNKESDGDVGIVPVAAEDFSVLSKNSENITACFYTNFIKPC